MSDPSFEPVEQIPAPQRGGPAVGSPGPIRLVAVDLDGTLLNDSKQVTEQTAAALACLPRRDVKLVIASARPPRSVRHIYQSLGLDTLQINYNGALIWDEPNQRPVFHRPIAGRLARRIIEHARDMFEETIVTAEVLDRWFTDRTDDAHTTETGKLFKPDVICPVDQLCAQPVTKLMLLGEPRVILRLEDTLAEAFEGEVSILKTDRDLLQIMHPEVGKAAALAKVAKWYGVPMTQVMAIGDAPNDVGMLQSAGVSVAMDNAHALVKDVADWVAPSNNDHGVHAALVRYGLC
jgi:Cof subfamily protein (haloacid dehalogenase superfamily)